jgi:hypothetical protein
MTTRTRLLSLASALSIALAPSASAQSLAVYGGVEAAGLGESSALLGASIAGGLGLSPVLGVTAQTYRFRNGAGGFISANAISPLIGLQYNTGRQMWMGGVGYSFVSTDLPAGTPGIGLSSGTEDGPFVLGQVNHWGDGNVDVQAIASFAFEPQYLWSRFRAAQRLGITPVFFGGEVVAQGSPSHDDDRVLVPGGPTVRVNVPSYWSFNVGPTLQYRVTENFRLLAAAGARIGTNDVPLSGYGKLEFLALVPRLFSAF